MKFLKDVFARVWAVWGLVSFIATFLLIYIPAMLTYLIPGTRGQYLFILMSRLWIRMWLFLVACPLKVRGQDNFKEGEIYIVTCNHNSFLDVPLSCPFIPGANKTIAKNSFAKIPIFGWYYSKGSVLVDRKCDESRRKSFMEMIQTLRQGMHMSIYPEGARNRTGQPLKTFHDGAFRLATETGKSIIPAVILNTKRALPVHKSFYFLPTRLQIHFLKPVPVEGKTAKELKQQVFNIMWEYYVANEGK